MRAEFGEYLSDEFGKFAELLALVKFDLVTLTFGVLGITWRRDDKANKDTKENERKEMLWPQLSDKSKIQKRERDLNH